MLYPSELWAHAPDYKAREGGGLLPLPPHPKALGKALPRREIEGEEGHRPEGDEGDPDRKEGGPPGRPDEGGVQGGARLKHGVGDGASPGAQGREERPEERGNPKEEGEAEKPRRLPLQERHPLPPYM